MKQTAMNRITKRLALLVCLLVSLPLMATAANPVVIVSEVTEADAALPVHVNGLVRARNDVLLPARSAGELMWSLEEGTRVSQGEVIAQVNRDPLELQLKEQQVLAERAEVNRRYLEGEVARLHKLEANNLAAKTQLAEMTSRRDLAENDLHVAKARIAQLENALKRTEIVSPVNGVIVERRIEAGEFARVGDTVARVVDPQMLEVSAAVPVVNLNRIDFNAEVMVSLPDLQFSADLRSMINAGNESSQTFDVLIDIPRELSANLVAGQFVEVDIQLLSNQALYVPRDAIVLRSDGSYVFRINEENVAQRVRVILGEGYGQMVSVRITEGDLSNGDRVAVRGAENLQDGQEVEPRAG
jgi:RND family efflux transporter MFP subunit